jgi:hypothetical protein
MADLHGLLELGKLCCEVTGLSLEAGQWLWLWQCEA